MSELLIAKGGYISRRHFSSNIVYDEQYRIQTKFPDTVWNFARAYVSERNVVTKSAIELSDIVFDKLQITLFPLIMTISIKGYRDCGQCKFQMFGKQTHEIYLFDYPRRYYTKKSKLELIEENMMDNIITIDNDIKRGI